MDGWTNWRPEKLRQMEVGGNRKARLFFEAKGVPKSPVRARYEHIGALMYISKLEADAQGQPFNEQRWSPPEWYHRMQQQQQAPQQSQGRSAAGSNNNTSSRFQGIGSAGSNPGRQSGSSDNEWLTSAISSGWSTVASTTSALASKAATSAQELADEAGKRAAKVDYQQAATESLSVVQTGLSWGWGAVTSLASQLSAQRASSDDDGLSALTRGVTVSTPADPTNRDRYSHIEHRAEGGGTPVDEEDDGMAAFRRNLPRGDGQYQGIGNTATSARNIASSSGGGTPVAAVARSPAPRATGKTPVTLSTPKSSGQLSTPSSQKKSDDWDWE